MTPPHSLLWAYYGRIKRQSIHSSQVDTLWVLQELNWDLYDGTVKKAATTQAGKCIPESIIAGSAVLDMHDEKVEDRAKPYSQNEDEG